MIKICTLLNGAIANDSRVIKTINSLSKIAEVDLFYVNGDETDKHLFNDNVRLFNINYNPKSLRVKLLDHSLFYNKFLFFTNAVFDQKNKYDYVYANDLPCLKPAYLLKKKMGCRLIYDSHEIFNGTLNQFFPDTKNLIKKIVFNILVFTMRFLGTLTEKKLVKKVDHFITTSESFKNYFQNKYNRFDIRIVMNCPQTTNNQEAYDFRKQFNLAKEDFIIIFQGVLNKGRALEEMIDAMLYVNDRIKLFVLGNGMLQQELILRSQNKGLNSKNFFIDRVPSQVLLHYTRGADCGINLQAPINISKKLASANKLFEYIHAGIPIIASDVPENNIVINKYKLGLLVENNPLKIAEALNYMSSVNLGTFKENCKKAALEYNWENQEKKLLEIFS